MIVARRSKGTVPAPLLRQQGVALVLVMWVAVLMTVIVGSFALTARTETLQARHLFDTTRARQAAEAGLHRAVFELRNQDPETRWFADGRTYPTRFENADLEISIRDESGKIDINQADREMLVALFSSLDLDLQEVEELVDAVIDWRDPDDLVSVHGAEDDDYEAAGFPYGAKDADFDIAAEIQQVMGMDWALYQQLEPAITVHGRGGAPNYAFAPLEVLRTIEGFDDETAQQFIDEREQITEFGVPLPVLPDGTSPVAQQGGTTYSVRSRATLDNGAWAEVEATIQLGNDAFGRPFRILHWKNI